MGKKISILVATVLATLVVGCAGNIKQIGTIGDTTFYRARSSSFAGPNALVIISKDNLTQHATVAESFGGSGIGPSVISAVGQTGAAVLLGRSFPKNVGDNVNVSGGNSSATGGTSSAHSSNGSVSNTSTSTSGATSASTSTAHAHDTSNVSNTATGGNATGGSATSTATGNGGAGGNGGSATGGKSHPASPGNGGTPGNGGQNPNKP